MVVDNGLRASDLRKFVDGKKKQAENIVTAYRESNGEIVHPAVLKGTLNALNAASGTHSTNFKRFETMEAAIQKQIAAIGDDSWKKHFLVGDDVLGKGNGMASRLGNATASKDAAAAGLELVTAKLKKESPLILAGVAGDIKASAQKYAEAYATIDPGLLDTIDTALRTLIRADAADAGKAQPKPSSELYKDLSNDDTRFLIGLLDDALKAKPLLDALISKLVELVPGTKGLKAPIKDVERCLVKISEKYKGMVDQVTDMARGTVVCKGAKELLRVVEFLKAEVEKGNVVVVRIKNRVAADFDAMDAGGYRDVLLNIAFKEGGHLVELQLNLEAFVEIKGSGGHAAYSTGRMLQAFERNVYSFIGSTNQASCEDIACGLTKRAMLIEMDDASGPLLLRGLEAPGVQLVELKILSVELPGDLKNAQWLARVAGQLAATLQTLEISQSGLEGELPDDLGKLRHLVSLNFSQNQLEGKL